MTTAIQHRTGDYYGDGTQNLIWEIQDETGVVAELYVSVERHEIANVDVRADHRGQGLASALYRAAAAETAIYHAPVGHRTDEGHAWALAVGGPTVEPYPCDCYACNMED